MTTAISINPSNEHSKTERSKKILGVSDLTVSFKSGKRLVNALRGVSFDLKEGTILAIAGESGSGKSVLAKAIMGLLPKANCQITGSIKLGEEEVIGASEKKLNKLRGKYVSMVFQDPMSTLNPVIPVGKQIVEAIKVHYDLPRSEVKDQALELLRSLQIPEPEKRFSYYPHQLSGGQRQRVVIAIALSCGPKILIADEPTTGLDPTIQKEIIELLIQEQINRGMSIIFISHDLELIGQVSDELHVMYAGKIVESGKARTILTRPIMPYTKALLDSIPPLAGTTQIIKSIRGMPPEPGNYPAGCPFAPRCDFAIPICFELEPPLLDFNVSGSKCACFFPISTPENEAALVLNSYKTISNIAFERRIGEPDSKIISNNNEMIDTKSERDLT